METCRKDLYRTNHLWGKIAWMSPTVRIMSSKHARIIIFVRLTEWIRANNEYIRIDYDLTRPMCGCCFFERNSGNWVNSLEVGKSTLNVCSLSEMTLAGWNTYIFTHASARRQKSCMRENPPSSGIGCWPWRAVVFFNRSAKLWRENIFTCDGRWIFVKYDTPLAGTVHRFCRHHAAV